MALGSNQYGANIYGAVENGGSTHVLLGYLATYQKVKGRLVGLLTVGTRLLGITR